MFTFLLVIHALVAALLVAVILVQKSEGGGLGMGGGSPAGLMSARGAADFLTRATTVLAALFVLLSIGVAAYATRAHAPQAIDTTLAHPQAPLSPVGPAVPGSTTPPAVPAGGVPIGR